MDSFLAGFADELVKLSVRSPDDAKKARIARRAQSAGGRLAHREQRAAGRAFRQKQMEAIQSAKTEAEKKRLVDEYIMASGAAGTKSGMKGIRHFLRTGKQPPNPYYRPGGYSNFFARGDEKKP